MELPRSISHLIEKIEEHQDINPGIAKKLLEESDITSEDLMRWKDFNHSCNDSYGRCLVHDGGFYEIMVMSWRDGDMAAIHDHGYTQWGAVKLFGKAEHAIFKFKNNTLTTCTRCCFPPETVLAVSHDMIHQMGNIGQPEYLTLHLYGCYDCKSGVTDEARLWNLELGSVDYTSGGIFFDLPEEAVIRREEGIQADFPTWLRHQVELTKRLLLKHRSFENSRVHCPREMKLIGQLFDRDVWLKLKEETKQMCADDQVLCKQYCNILSQELIAAAKLQVELVEKNLIDFCCKSYIENLKTLLENQDNFVSQFISLLDTTFHIQYEMRLAS